jgi:hypothetical protein
MSFTKIIAAAASLTSLAALATVPALAESTSMKPLQAASFNVGSEHAISYFTSDCVDVGQTARWRERLKTGWAAA